MKSLISALAAVLLMAGSASAATVSIVRSTTNNTRSQNVLDARDAWLTYVSGLGSITAMEDFEAYQAGTHYSTLDTAVGRFVAGGSVSTGAGTRRREVSIHDQNTTFFSGRFNYTDGGANWLDSNDITDVSLLFLDLPPVHFLSFVITDVNDVNGSLVLQFADGSSMTTPLAFGGRNPSGVSYFVSYEGEALSSVRWLNSSTNDGWGIDDVFIGMRQTGDPVVPEPSTYALIGAGLLAVGVARRRR